LVGEGDAAAQRVEVGEVDLGQVFRARDGAAAVRSDQVARGHTILEERSDRRRVQARNVIAFEERVDDQLPVARHVMRTAVEEVHTGQIECVEVCGEGVCMAEVGILARREPDQPARFMARQLLEVMLGLVQPRKSLGARQRGERAVELVAPCVIGTDEQVRAHRFLPLNQPRAAMLADVEENMRHALLVAGEEQRFAKSVMRQRHARLEQRGRRNDLRQAVEQPCFLRREPLWRGVGAGGNMLHFGGAFGAAVDDRLRQRLLSRRRAALPAQHASRDVHKNDSTLQHM
jgi:hypothetical protein